ncbi:DUF3189 family protein [Terrilactibacillus sp. BCM23-1]|uniref:DUF3189 family protein n=1 Tax=Terrilactibacillus tamarindi TaxID=2599694 RepID=A0A6N8CMT7_9BACI|nr:DUF3189 family protein [Terrilactibacillus tamarindi]MTT30948.1 DUF3189 family protein [Terrilactibacillus tamarindi]
MIYIYNDYGGTHTTALAAAYHLNKLPKEGKLTKEQILETPFFNKLKTSDMGVLFFHGIDSDGNSVYTVGRGAAKQMKRLLKSLTELLQEKYNGTEKVVLSNTSPTVPITMTFGGLFSRRLHIDFIGVPLLVLGAKQCCHDILRVVEHTKYVGKTTSAKLTVLDNKEFK